jgi:hypothetical protein
MGRQRSELAVRIYPKQPAVGKRVLCREIRTTDADEVINLLTLGFLPSRGRAFWANAWQLLTDRPVPAGLPRYGYLLESEGKPVGVILLICTEINDGEKTRVQCNFSSWYVDPDYRAFATLLISCTLKRKDVTYFNVTPAPHTLAILKAQGFEPFSKGRVTALPALTWPRPNCRIEIVERESPLPLGLSAHERRLLPIHADYGCITLICHAEDGPHPFVFARRRKWGVVPFAFLIYCRAPEEFAHFAGNLGRYLFGAGIPIVIVDANGPISGLVGRYSNTNPKYYRGPDKPRLGDLSFSERAMFEV